MGATQSDLGARSYCHLADESDNTAIEEGFHVMLVDRESDESGWWGRVLADGDCAGRTDPGGSDNRAEISADDRRIDVTTPHDYGFRIYDNEMSSGYDVSWVTDAMIHDSWPEVMGFPAATDLTFRVGIRTTDATTDHSLTVDRIHIELVP